MIRGFAAIALALLSGAAPAAQVGVYPAGTRLPVYAAADFSPDIPLVAKSVTGSTFYSIGVAGRSYAWEGAYEPWTLTTPSPGTIRIEIHQGDQNLWDASVGHSVDRAELASRDLVAKVGQAVRVNYLFSVNPGAPIKAAWNVVGQLRQDQPSASPAFGFYFNGSDVLCAQVNYAGSNAGAWVSKVIWSDGKPIVRGQRYRMQIDARWNPDGTGTITATRDGVLLFNYTGPTGYPTMTGVKWSFGWYRPSSATEVEAVRYGAMSITNPR